MKLPSNTLPLSAEQFITEFEAYAAQRDAHKLTEGIPAPFPSHEVFRVMYERMERGEEIEIFDTGEPEPPIDLAEELTRDKPLLRKFTKA